MMDTQVYTDADTASALVTILYLSDYAHVLECASGWVRVDLNLGDPMRAPQGGFRRTGSVITGIAAGYRAEKLQTGN